MNVSYEQILDFQEFLYNIGATYVYGLEDEIVHFYNIYLNRGNIAHKFVKTD